MNPDIYTNIRKSDIYKVDYTVAELEDLDRTNGTCFFTSKSSGERYATSLERCSCPAYCKGYACKHMLVILDKLYLLYTLLSRGVLYSPPVSVV